MNNSEIILPPEIEALVQERGKIWAAYDLGTQDAKTLASLGQEIDRSGETTPVDNLTANGLPTEEIGAAIFTFRNEKHSVDDLMREIDDKTDQIAAIRSHAQSMYVAIGVGAVILIGILFLAFRSMM